MVPSPLVPWPADLARVDDPAAPGPSFEMEVVSRDLDEREGVVLIEVRGGEARWPNVPPAELTARSVDEIRNALLRLDPLVDVVVAREHDVDTVLDEQGLECDAQVD